MLNSTTASQLPGPPHFVDLHVNPGESVSIQFFDGNETILRGPTTIKMISQHAYPPMPMPVQVPPGHMIQQIVDENGTLRHIILSALTNANGNNNFTSSTSQFVSHQQLQQSPGGSPYCCCCYNTCSSANGNQTLMTSPVANQHLQPQLSHNNQMVFPLNSHSFVRHRRSSRNYSSNAKRSNSSNFSSNYYSANPIGKVNNGRYKQSDNPKMSYHNRHSTNLNYDPISSYDSSNDTKYYLNKSYDYSCNSSNASQASTVDQINDNPKYFRDDSYSIEDEYLIKKSSYEIDLNTNQQLNSCCLGCENKDDNLTNDDEGLSRKSSLSECIDNCNNNQQDSLLSTPTVTFITDNIDNDSINFDVNDSDPPIDVTQESIKLGDNDAVSDAPNFSDKSDVAIDFIPVTNNDNYENDHNQKLNLHENIVEPSDHLPIKASETRLDTNVDDSDPGSSEPYSPRESVSIEADEGRKTPTENASPSDNIKFVGNGNIESYYTSIEPVHDTGSDDNESDKTDSDDYRDEENSILNPIYVNSHQRSPKNLLPKVEAINLTYNSLSPCSLRLKWFFNQPNDHPEHKRHFIVNMLLNNLEDSPNSRIVHQGHTTTCRVFHLQPQQKYTFRVRTSTEEAVLISNLLTVITPEQQSIAGAKVSGRKSKQQLQQQLLQQQQQIFQQQQLLRQQQHLVEERQATSSGHSLLSQSGLSSDQRCAILILVGFTFFALIVAVMIQNLLGSGSQ